MRRVRRAMMETNNCGRGADGSARRRLNGARLGRVFVERQMRSRSMVVAGKNWIAYVDAEIAAMEHAGRGLTSNRLSGAVRAVIRPRCDLAQVRLGRGRVNRVLLSRPWRAFDFVKQGFLSSRIV